MGDPGGERPGGGTGMDTVIPKEGGAEGEEKARLTLNDLQTDRQGRSTASWEQVIVYLKACLQREQKSLSKLGRRTCLGWQVRLPGGPCQASQCHGAVGKGEGNAEIG